jgi:hypothetical protein
MKIRLNKVEACYRSVKNRFHSFLLHEKVGYAVAQLVEALRYKPESRGFDSGWSHWNFSVT